MRLRGETLREADRHEAMLVVRIVRSERSVLKRTGDPVQVRVVAQRSGGNGKPAIVPVELRFAFLYDRELARGLVVLD